MGRGVFYALIRQFRSVKSKIWNPLGGGGLTVPPDFAHSHACFGFISFAVLILSVFILRRIIII